MFVGRCAQMYTKFSQNDKRKSPLFEFQCALITIGDKMKKI